MKKNFQMVVNIIFATILTTIILNIFISISWKAYNKYKYSSKNPFPEIVRSNFEINEEQQSTLFFNTHKMKYYYRGFVGPLPDNTISEFVNYKKLKGRKTLNKNMKCSKNILFFGGSTTFGWLSIDDKTIPSQFSKNLNNQNDDYCVFNFGSPWFYSKQENNFLIDLMERNIIKPDYAIFLDGINERCNGFQYANNLREQFDEIIVDHRTDITKKKLLPFLKSTPLYQLFDRISGASNYNFSNLKENVDCSRNELKDLFESRLKFRLKICENYKIQCLSFLQPFGTVHGNIYPASNEIKQYYKKKYNAFKKIPKNLIIDISKVLEDDQNEYSYVDKIHYSHYANNLLAMKILTNFNNLNIIN